MTQKWAEIMLNIKSCFDKEYNKFMKNNQASATFNKAWESKH